MKWIHILIKWLKLIDSVFSALYEAGSQGRGFCCPLKAETYWNSLTCLIFTHEVLC